VTERQRGTCCLCQAVGQLINYLDSNLMTLNSNLLRSNFLRILNSIWQQVLEEFDEVLSRPNDVRCSSVGFSWFGYLFIFTYLPAYVPKVKQNKNVALSRRNTTGPPCSVGRPTAGAPDGRRVRPPAGSVTDDDDRRQRPLLVSPLHYAYTGQ